MILFLFWFLLLLAVLIHELGHVFEMRNAGLRIKRFGIGLPIPFLPALRLNIKNLTFEIHLALLGAFVEPANEEILNDLPFKNKIAIFCGGILANIIFALMLLIISIFLLEVIHDRHLVLNGQTLVMAWIMPVCILGIILLGAMRNFFYRLVPFIGIPLLCLIVLLTLSSLMSRPIEDGGFIGLNSMVRDQVAVGDTGIANVFILSAITSMILGLGNAIPLTGLDGYHAFKTSIEYYWGEKYINNSLFKTFSYIGLALLIVLLVLPLISDFFSLVLS